MDDPPQIGMTENATAAYVADLSLSPLLPGTIFAGRYKLREMLGEGGMGAVYAADQLEPVQRRVALKIVKAGLHTAQLRARFDQERQALALMDHPNIAKVLDAGVADGGLPYFVMELVKGVPLTKYCDDAKLSPKERLELFIPICQAVQHAHQKGVIHRDLKPNNILVGLYDGRPVPKVIDFGVAKATGSRLTEQSIYTEVGSLVGTLEYMSPEQAEPDNLDIDTRSDIYALGVILYELLTGTVPFSRADLASAGFVEMLRIIKEIEPAKPSTRISSSGTLPSIAANRHMEPSKLSQFVRGELDWIVMKCLEKDRRRRYETANQLSMEILRYLAAEPVLAGPPSARYRLQKFLQRNRGPVIAASLVFLALLAGFAAATWGWIEARRQERIALDEASEKEKARAAEAERARGELVAKRELAGKNVALAEANERERERFDLAMKAIETFHTGVSEDLLLKEVQFKELREKLLSEAAQFYGQLEKILHGKTDSRSRRALGAGYFQLGLLTERIGSKPQALAVQRKALEVRRELAGTPGADIEIRLDVARSLGAVGVLIHATGDRPGALATYQEQRELAERLLAESPNDSVRAVLAQSLYRIGYLLSETAGKASEALESHEKALVIQHKLAEANPEMAQFQCDLAKSYYDIGWLHSQTGKRTAALESHEKALAIRQKLAATHPGILLYQSDVGWSLHNIGSLQSQMGRTTEALAAYNQALEIRQKLAEANPAVTKFQRDLGWSHNNLGYLLREMGNLGASLKSHEKSRTIRQNLADANPTVTGFQSDLSDSHFNIGSVLLGLGKPREALESYQRAVSVQQKLTDANPSATQFQRNLANSFNSIGLVLSITGKPARAMESFRRAEAIQQKLVDANPAVTEFQSDLAQSHLNIGHVLAQTGRPDKAIDSYEQALLRWQKLADAHPEVMLFQSDLADCHNSLGRVWGRRKRFAESVAALERGLSLRQKLVESHPENSEFIHDLGLSHASMGWARVRAGLPRQAAAELGRALELWKRDSILPTEIKFERARVLSLLAGLGVDAGSGVTAAQAAAYADQAVAGLRDAVAAGWAQAEELLEPDFDPVRGREDFKQVLTKLEESKPPIGGPNKK